MRILRIAIDLSFEFYFKTFVDLLTTKNIIIIYYNINLFFVIQCGFATVSLHHYHLIKF